MQQLRWNSLLAQSGAPGAAGPSAGLGEGAQVGGARQLEPTTKSAAQMGLQEILASGEYWPGACAPHRAGQYIARLTGANRVRAPTPATARHHHPHPTPTEPTQQQQTAQLITGICSSATSLSVSAVCSTTRPAFW